MGVRMTVRTSGYRPIVEQPVVTQGNWSENAPRSISGRDAAGVGSVEQGREYDLTDVERRRRGEGVRLRGGGDLPQNVRVGVAAKSDRDHPDRLADVAAGGLQIVDQLGQGEAALHVV